MPVRARRCRAGAASRLPAATGRVLSRHTGYDASLTRATLQACVPAGGSCADECGGYAQMHEHCRVCTQACRRCEQARRELLSSLS
jgi:hypothetical protein